MLVAIVVDADDLCPLSNGHTSDSSPETTRDPFEISACYSAFCCRINCQGKYKQKYITNNTRYKGTVLLNAISVPFIVNSKTKTLNQLNNLQNIGNLPEGLEDSSRVLLLRNYHMLRTGYITITLLK